MKRIIRILSVILVLTAVFSCSSCMALDEAKEHHIICDDESGETVLSYKNKEYQIFNSNGLTTNYFASGYYNYYHVTSPDVPVLLAFYDGNICEYDSEADIICYDGNLYCAKDRIDEYEKKFERNNLDGLVLRVNAYDYEDEYGFYRSSKNINTPYYKLITLSEDMTETIYKAFKGEAVDKSIFPDIDYFYDESYRLTLYRSSTDGEIIDEEGYIDIHSYAKVYYATDDGLDTIYELPRNVGEKLENMIQTEY